MARSPTTTEKPLHWVGSSKKDLSPSGVSTAKHDVVLIHERLRRAQTDYEVRYASEED